MPPDGAFHNRILAGVDPMTKYVQILLRIGMFVGLHIGMLAGVWALI
jgi:hypothetical protein